VVYPFHSVQKEGKVVLGSKLPASLPVSVPSGPAVEAKEGERGVKGPNSRGGRSREREKEAAALKSLRAELAEQN